MKQKTNAVNLAESQEQHVSWLPLIVILLAQIQMAFNVFAIPVSVGAIVDDFGVSPTDIGTALVIYSLFVAAFVMVGAKIGRLFGERLVFQVSALIYWGFNGPDGLFPESQYNVPGPGPGRAGRRPTRANACCLDRLQLSRQTAGSGLGHPGRNPGNFRRIGLLCGWCIQYAIQLAGHLWFAHCFISGCDLSQLSIENNSQTIRYPH